MCALYVRCALSVLQKECRKVWGARYTLGARYLYFKRNVEKFGVRVIGRKIRYFGMWHIISISPWLWRIFSCFGLHKHIIYWQNTVSCVGSMMVKQNYALQRGPILYSVTSCFILNYALVVICSVIRIQVSCTVILCCWVSSCWHIGSGIENIILALLDPHDRRIAILQNFGKHSPETQSHITEDVTYQQYHCGDVKFHYVIWLQS